MANSWHTLREQRYLLDWPLYERHIVPMIKRWCSDRNLPLYDICSWKNARPGFIGVDVMPFPGVIQADLNQKWPFEDNSVGCISATDAIEHLRDKHHTMSEIYRVLAPGGYFISYTPHGLSEGGIGDPSHVSFWNSRTFRYYDDGKVAKYIGNETIRFRPMWDFTSGINNDLRYVTYHAVALKGGEEEDESRGERRI